APDIKRKGARRRMPLMIRFSCPGCQNVLKAPDDAAGRRVACPRCGSPLSIPSGQAPTRGEAPPARTTPGQVRVHCPGCGQTIDLPPADLSLLIRCAQCRTHSVPSRVASQAARRHPAQPPATPQSRRKLLLAGGVIAGSVGVVCTLLCCGLGFSTLFT